MDVKCDIFYISYQSSENSTTHYINEMHLSYTTVIQYLK